MFSGIVSIYMKQYSFQGFNGNTGVNKKGIVYWENLNLKMNKIILILD